ncbi:hypothetical protein [Planosporangium mesophilum]|uniref:Uncharacterized protein n=1 Tax=Planosporangium mesophilum TaxID=689768 RepID=A0A8J3TFU4_9ACTN|nr:hypothetical protein [Planosporangium mesophilum]NJC85752.1 hypothetical protein [Planosporangium mesophilum]GII24781.1 hypothetical protein Pme01_43780 [Planosporangium mesophilum]
MTNRRTLLADVAELGNVLRAMDEWEAAGGDVTSAQGRRSFVDNLDDGATDELSGLALTKLARLVSEEQRRMFDERHTDDTSVTVPGPLPTPRQRYRPVAV